jgi:hypothetical protein
MLSGQRPKKAKGRSAPGMPPDSTLGRCHNNHCASARPQSITPSQGKSGTQSSVIGLCVVRPTQLVQRVSKNTCAMNLGAASATAPSGHNHQPNGAATRHNTNISAMPCNTPKLIQLLGNMR